MFAVIFEVRPRADQWEAYLALAQELRPRLIEMDGFLSVERFSARRTPGLLLSFSLWRDEKALVRWRTEGRHHAVQELGRTKTFEDYHLRIGEAVSDSARDTPPTQQRFDATQVGSARSVGILEVAMTASAGAFLADEELSGLLVGSSISLADCEIYDSIYAPGKSLLLFPLEEAAPLPAWTPAQGEERRALQVRIIRDYGMFDRREAPQYYPEAPSAS
ncbi:antibiotic biosynthesis monooxygenase family protein [Roseixanthobacter glucoisosaccharinicivorans]|uniref:antibiotic biosynthesis monooxygenase family protein n=1 Tax=Roseixanthobacter glucoisosaccharinicivorans TaxID=3119923 RepID=UPI00372C996B